MIVDAKKFAKPALDAFLKTGYSENYFCEKTGLSPRTFKRIIGGKLVTHTSIFKFCKVLDLNPQDYIDYGGG